MKFVFGEESLMGMLNRFSYRGIIGIAYSNTLTGVLAFLLFVAFTALALIGLVQVIKWIAIGKKK